MRDYLASPHMQKLYGDTLRKGQDGGLTKTLRNATKNHRLSVSSGSDDKTTKRKRNPPQVLINVADRITKNVKEVQGTVEKVLEETADALEEFLGKSEELTFFHLLFGFFSEN
jgi:phosphatidylethanolamine N-methyltransferase